MRITVSGLPGSGTTSLSRYLQERLRFEMISAGEVFRALAEEHNLDLAGFGKLAESDPAIDRIIDERQAEIARSRDNIIVEGRLSGWMIPEADVKIWLTAPITCRVKRIVFRDHVADEETAQRITIEREACEALRYRSYYNIDINDLTPYHLVLNSERWGVADIGQIVETAICVLKK